MSLRVKWTMVAILLALAPIVLISALALRNFRSGLEASEKALENLAVVQIREGLSSRLDGAEDVTRRMAMVFGEHDIESDDARLNIVRGLLASEPTLDAAQVFGPDGKSWGQIAQGAATEFAPISDATGTASAVLAALPNQSWLPSTPGASKLVYRANIGKTEPPASLLGYVGTAALKEQTSVVSLGAFAAGDARVVVFDGSFNVVAGRGDIAAAREFANLVGVTPNSQDTIATRSQLTLGGAPAVGTLGTLKKHHLMVVVMRPESEAYPDYQRVKQLLLLSACGVALIAFAVAALLAHRTTSPILALVELTKRYGARDFGARSSVRTGDELQALGSSLELMAKSISAGEAEVLRRSAVEANFARFLPEAVAAKIASGDGHVELGGKRRDITVMFADVCAFTKFSESATPETVVAFLNELFGLTSEIVFRHGGIVDKFLGDSLMALFGAVSDDTDHAARALACAEDMHRFVETMLPVWSEKYGFEVRLAIGVNAGSAVVGNLGSEKRMEFTAIGDVINIAARLETLARPGQTLLTQEVVSGAGDKFEYASLGMQALRGKSDKVEIFELETV
jgi:adenylate cyclase